MAMAFNDLQIVTEQECYSDPGQEIAHTFILSLCPGCMGVDMKQQRKPLSLTVGDLPHNPGSALCSCVCWSHGVCVLGQAGVMSVSRCKGFVMRQLSSQFYLWPALYMILALQFYYL